MHATNYDDDDVDLRRRRFDRRSVITLTIDAAARYRTCMQSAMRLVESKRAAARDDIRHRL